LEAIIHEQLRDHLKESQIIAQGHYWLPDPTLTITLALYPALCCPFFFIFSTLFLFLPIFSLLLPLPCNRSHLSI